MATEEELYAVRSLASIAQVAVIRFKGGNPAPRTALDRARSWWWGQQEGSEGTTIRGTVWQDAWSRERLGWRERAAFLNRDELFGVDYKVCRHCRIGWAEQPTTYNEEYRRCGLARVALETLRQEHPGLEWHTLGGHFADSAPFWQAVGSGVSGGYTKRSVCRHKSPGG